MKSKIFVLGITALMVLGCKSNRNCQEQWVNCLNVALQKEMNAKNQYSGCKEIARMYFEMAFDTCSGIQDHTAYLACWQRALYESSRKHFECDSLLAVKMDSIMTLRYTCNTAFLSCMGD